MCLRFLVIHFYGHCCWLGEVVFCSYKREFLLLFLQGWWYICKEVLYQGLFMFFCQSSLWPCSHQYIMWPSVCSCECRGKYAWGNHAQKLMFALTYCWHSVCIKFWAHCCIFGGLWFKFWPICDRLFMAFHSLVIEMPGISSSQATTASFHILYSTLFTDCTVIVC